MISEKEGSNSLIKDASWQALQRGRCGLLKKELNSFYRNIGFVNKGLASLLIIFGFLFPLLSTAQNTITTNQFLATALNDQSVLLHDRQLDFLKNTDHELPWAEELEFRTETDEMDLNRQEYLMRFRFHTKAEIKAQRNLHRSEIQLQEIDKIQLLENALLDNYFLLVKYITLNREINIKQQQKLVATDKSNVLRKKAAALSDVDLNDLLVAENKNHDLELELMELEGEFDQLKMIFNRAANSSDGIELDASSFINISDVKEKIEILPRSMASNLALSERRMEFERIGLEMEKEKAEKNWQLDYVQFKVAGRDNLNYAREWSFGMGMEIPLKEANKLAKNDNMLEHIELQNRYMLQEVAITDQLLKTYEEMYLKIKLHELAIRQLTDSQLQYSFDNYPQYRNANPLDLLNIKSNILKRQADQLEIEKDIYLLYLDIIEMTGKAVEMPLRNYLTKDWELIE